MNFGQGVVTIAYRPIPFEGTLTPSKVLMSYGFGERIFGGGKPIEPMPAIDPPIVCITDPAYRQPSQRPCLRSTRTQGSTACPRSRS